MITLEIVYDYNIILYTIIIFNIFKHYRWKTKIYLENIYLF